MRVREGSIIMVRGAWGTHPAVRAVVTGVHADVKHGDPGISYTEVETKEDHWAYMYQISSVVTY